MNILKLICPVLLAVIVSGNTDTKQYRSYINLSGEWQFALDTARVGEAQQWYLIDYDDSVRLPGTTDLNRKGFLNRDTTTMHLNRIYKYEGIAWYRKEIDIPESYREKHVQLFLERTRSSRIWIDSLFIGTSRLLQSPQVFDVTGSLTPGKHHITVQVNNDLGLTPYGNVHIYSDDTQTNWNGIIGRLFIEATAKTHISNIRVFPDIERQKLGVELDIDNKLDLEQVDIELSVEKSFDGKTSRLETLKTTAACRSIIMLEYDLSGACSLWDEYEQALYKLTAVISSGDLRDSRTVPFGLRKFEVKNTQFSINGNVTFLRGKHEAAVFPLTGFPPMNVEDWVRVYRIAKSYGINHYRFHSYCPPEAAFTAADMEGMYLQAELPFWGGLESDTIADMLREEGYAMLDAYGNHPSFVLFSHGNEIWSGHDRVEENINALKEYDGRPLYTMGANNNIGYVAPRECSDFYVGARTPYAYDTILTHTRLTHAFADSRDGGILNTMLPSTQTNFSYAVAHMDIPVISHEIGQYQIYPDYGELKKYTGVLKAWNLEVFRNRLNAKGMGMMDSAFQRASGAWSALCYKAEMEAAFRTKGLAGFQLLDLQDFPGQGTALVGVLDAFMDSKNVISQEEWRHSCNDVVVLLEFPGYCWKTDEFFKAEIVVANYSNKDISGDIIWKIMNQYGNVLYDGTIACSEIEKGGLRIVGEVNADLSSINEAQKLTLSCSVSGTGYGNSYDIWVYPPENTVRLPENIIVADRLNEKVLDILSQGGKVLLFPQTGDVRDKSVPGLFPPDFWNYGMFRGISKRLGKPVSPGTLGLLMDPEHPIFNDFPTDFHTNWQWFSIIKKSNSLILDDTSPDYRPIVQVIDNLERNHKLGLICEFKSGKGKLLVCMSRLNQITDRPEGRQLYQSIVNYMVSGDFEPCYELSRNELIDLFFK